MSRDWITQFRYFVPWPPDLDKVLPRCYELLPDHALWETRYRVEVATFFGFARSAAGEVGLMLAPLGVGEVGAIVLVDGETETAFEGTDMVLEAMRDTC